MNSLNVRYSYIPGNKMRPKLAGRINLANLLNLSELKFYELIKQIENTTLFKKLVSPQNITLKVIHYDRFQNSSLKSDHFLLNKQFNSNIYQLDIASLIEGNKRIINKIKEIGEEKFKKFFLFCDTDHSPDKIAKICHLNMDEIEEINCLIDKITLKTAFDSYSSTPKVKDIQYYKIASIEKDTHNQLFISYFSPYHARGRYLINHTKIKKLKNEGYFSSEEKKELRSLLTRLEFINTRKRLLFEVIKNIIQKQKKYLFNKDIRSLKPCTQNILAKDLNVNPSIISRAIWNKSIYTPWGQEYPLKFFLPNKKRIIKIFIKDIISKRKSGISARLIKEELKHKWNIIVSDRSIAYYKKELLQGMK